MKKKLNVPHISKMTEDPSQPHLGKGTFWKPAAKPLVFGRQPSMPWHKQCECGHSEKSHKLGWCLECDCEKFLETGKHD